MSNMHLCSRKAIALHNMNIENAMAYESRTLLPPTPHTKATPVVTIIDADA